ncbi:MAG: heme lyase CcmF/NrfE family subunit [Chloroflexi bacterium]|nr:heme lyase CcmF/NrfE family subunit [Chloroflexota bacterium]
MIGALGLTATILGAAASLFGIVAATLAARSRWPIGVAIGAAWATFAALAAANLVMVVALVSRDFSIAYVAQVGSRATPLLFTVASLWGALEGSILFWSALAAGVAVLLVKRTRGEGEHARLPGSLAVLLALTAFFALIAAGPGNPWRRVFPVPLDGPGPNPLLQDHPLMALHPPLLYLGFVGLAVPFAITVDALLRGRLDDAWLRVASRWTLGPWILLTLGLVAGAWWSYAVLGWGGYWGWDPVENVALLPWLTATAFLHSAMVGRRRGSLLAWNVALVSASFMLTLFATLVTRSGVLDSVHAFTRSVIGSLFVGLLGAVLVGTVGLLAFRLPAAGDGARLGARGRAFLLNNLLLATLAATVLLGTVFPLLVEAVTNTRVSVGAPYFERLTGPLGIGLLVLVGIGPTLPWGDWSPAARRALVPSALAAAILAGLLVAIRSDPAAVAGGAAGAFALVQSLSILVRRLFRIDRPGRLPGIRLRASTTRAAGGLVAHIGVAVLAIAVVASATGTREAVVALRPGASATVLGQTVAYLGSEKRPGPNRMVIAARLRLGSGAGGAELRPALNVFGASTQAIATPAIVSGTLADVYVTLLNLDEATGTATIRIGTHPLVSWVWPAGGIVALGGLLALGGWPYPRRVRSEAEEPARPAVLAPDGGLDVVSG